MSGNARPASPLSRGAGEGQGVGAFHRSDDFPVRADLVPPSLAGKGAGGLGPSPPTGGGPRLPDEWLVTDGRGGYASGTIDGPSTRRYHGLLVVPLSPPLGRHVLLSRIEEEVIVGGAAWRLSASEFVGARVDASPGVEAVGFAVADGRATWTIDVAGQGTLEREVRMDDGLTATFVRYRWDGPAACGLVLRPLATSRDFHSESRGDATWHFDIRRVEHAGIGGLGVQAHRHAPAWQLLVQPPPGARWHWDFDQATWWWDVLHREERARGFDHVEDLYCLGAISVDLKPGESLAVGASLAVDGPSTASRMVEAARGEGLGVGAFHSGDDLPARADPATPSLADALRPAANSFLVRRALPVADAGDAKASGWTVLAGYHWFGDWGRDTFIALPGLARLTGRLDVARDVLRSWARVADRGMLPNRFPDSGAPLGEGAFNSIDAALWFLRAVGEVDALGTGPSLARELRPVIWSILDHHLAGTRHGIVADPADGLLRTDDGQLTWMDARVDGIDQVPRAGKPVEVNALWIHALDRAVGWATASSDAAAARRYGEARDRAAGAFARRYWWDGEAAVDGGVPGTGGYLLDCIDGPGGDDGSLRPNQVIAAALKTTPLTVARRRAVVDVARAHLLVPRGLRTLPPADERYRGQCVGDAASRDGAYHQGTAWAWLLGPFIDAWLLAGGTVHEARAFVEPMRDHVRHEACAGTVSEIFDGDAPHHPRGAVSQAWSVAEVGRAWLATSGRLLAT